MPPDFETHTQNAVRVLYFSDTGVARKPHPQLAQCFTFDETYDVVRDIRTMSYNAQCDELFIADGDGVVRSTRVRANSGAADLHDVYPYGGSALDTSTDVTSVCHISDSDTLFICLSERPPQIGVFALMKYRVNWLVVLSRSRSKWHEAYRLQTEQLPTLSCALSDSRVLIGNNDSEYLQLIHVQSGPLIAHEQRILVPEKYRYFSATCGSGGDKHVAMSYADESVRVHRLVGDKLEEMARIRLEIPYLLLWVAARLFVSVLDGSGVVELKLNDKRLECLDVLIAATDKIRVWTWCASDDGLIFCNSNNDDLDELLHYTLKKQ